MTNLLLKACVWSDLLLWLLKILSAKEYILKIEKKYDVSPTIIKNLDPIHPKIETRCAWCSKSDSM